MANITRGHTFSSGDLVTADKLHNLVDSASIANIAEAALADGSHIITSGTTAPSPATAGIVWWDTTTTEADGYGILKIYDGSRWQSVAKNVEQVFTNTSDDPLTSGDVVILDIGADRSVTTTTTPASTDFFGIMATSSSGSGDTTAGNDGRVVRSGLMIVNTTGDVTRGDYLGTSDTVKLAKSLGASPSAGAFGRAVANPNSIEGKWLVALSGKPSQPMGTSYPVSITNSFGSSFSQAFSRIDSSSSGNTIAFVSFTVTPVTSKPFIIDIDGRVFKSGSSTSTSTYALGQLFLREDWVLGGDPGTQIGGSLLQDAQGGSVAVGSSGSGNELYLNGRIVVPNTDTITRNFVITDAGSDSTGTLYFRGRFQVVQWTVA